MWNEQKNQDSLVQHSFCRIFKYVAKCRGGRHFVTTFSNPVAASLFADVKSWRHNGFPDNEKCSMLYYTIGIIFKILHQRSHRISDGLCNKVLVWQRLREVIVWNLRQATFVFLYRVKHTALRHWPIILSCNILIIYSVWYQSF